MRVFIGGLLPGQRRLVEQNCPEGISLRFAPADRKAPVWVSAASGCDVCVVLVDFCNHEHVEALLVAGHKVRRHSGGMSRLKALLRSLQTETPA